MPIVPCFAYNHIIKQQMSLFLNENGKHSLPSPQKVWYKKAKSWYKNRNSWHLTLKITY